MAEMMSSAAEAVMGSVIDKLSAMLTENYQLPSDVKRGIKSLKEELSTMDAVLQMLTDKADDHITPLEKDWRSKVRALSYDIEDCIDRFMLNHSHGDEGSTPSFVQKAIQMVKKLFKDRGIAEEIRQLKRLVSEQSDRAKRYYDINQCLLTSPQPVPLDLRAPALFQEARDLVGVDGPREKIIQLLKCEEKEHKVVSIYGIGGQGKTTLAMEVYHKITEAFDCRAFVSVSQTPDTKKLLRDILSQISKRDFDRSERMETDEQLIRTVRECLKDKRYFILIDDIWSEPAWDLVHSALPQNDNGSRIITTTCSKTVARSCCTGIAEQMYEAKPLGDDDSRRLFFKRLFCSSEVCPQDLREVCSEILRKCGGLPLAIISIAGLLATRSQTVDVWVNLLESISAAVDKDSPIDKMKRILLLSYYDLPHNLKSCLLYLSVFPEDYSIDCRQLILLWVAEGLIPGQDRESMEQRGRNYLNELINRSLVQPTKVGIDGATVKKCRVHDIILEFIVSKAVDNNFVTIWNGNAFSDNYYSKSIRRLSIQKDISGRAEEIGKALIRNAAHIRSINIFGSNKFVVTEHASKFLSSQVLKVLNIEVWDVECYLGHVKSFGQLKYLRIACNVQCDCMVPDNFEKLQHLETLHLSHPPTSIFQLQNLVRLFVEYSQRLPDGIENLRALEELSTIGLQIQSVKFIQGLGALTNLRVLGTDWGPSTKESVRNMEDRKKVCISSLSKLFMSLRELRTYTFVHERGSFTMDHFFDLNSVDPATPPPLWRLRSRTCNLNSMGPQISLLVNLTRLHIEVCGEAEASTEGINTLASLPKLLSLTVSVCLDYDEHRGSGILAPRYVINRQGFQLLVKFNFRCWCEAAVEFETGAMPKLQKLNLRLKARCQFKYEEGGLVRGLQNLASLNHVDVYIDSMYAVADEVEALHDDISSAGGAHPNRPILEVKTELQFLMAQGCSRRPLDNPIQEAT